MSQIVHTNFPTSHSGVNRLHSAYDGIRQVVNQIRGARGLRGALVAGGVSAAIVVADQIVSAWADGHLLLAWIAMWVIVFTLLAMFSDAIRDWPGALMQRYAAWAADADQRTADLRTWDAALADPRLMAELTEAQVRAEQEAAQNGTTPPRWPFPKLSAARATELKWS